MFGLKVFDFRLNVFVSKTSKETKNDQIYRWYIEHMNASPPYTYSSDDDEPWARGKRRPT